jgi:tRNA-dihydrouridine synthase
MLKKRIIPCLDVKNGRVVKGINFLNLKDAGDPVEQARIYDKGGADEICFLDITASNENRKILLNKVTETARNCFVPLTVGGGVTNIEDIKNLLLAGADKVSINTAAVKNHNFIKQSSVRFGSQCIVIAIDVKKVANNKWEVFSLSLIYSHIFGNLSRVFSLKQSFISKITLELSKNLHPDPSKRSSLMKVKETFEKLFDTNLDWKFVEELDINKMSLLKEELER